MRASNATPSVLPGRPQPPRQFQTFGGPAYVASPPQEELLINLSPPPGYGTTSQAREQGAWQEAIHVQNVASRTYGNDHLSMEIPMEFDALHPSIVSLHPVEAYQRSDVRTMSQESPMPASRPGNARTIPSVRDLEPLPPSAGLHGFSSRQRELRGGVENEARRITSLHNQLLQASVNVDRLRRDMQYVDGRILAAQRQSWDCNPPQARDEDQEAFDNLPFGGEDNEESSPIIAVSTTGGSSLICSPTEDEGLDAN